MLPLLRIYASVISLVWLLFSVSLFSPALFYAIPSPPTPSALHRYCIGDIAWVRYSHYHPCYDFHGGFRRSFYTTFRSEGVLFQAIHHRLPFPVTQSKVYHLSFDSGEAYVSQQQTQWSLHSSMLPFEVAGPLLQISLINYGTSSTSTASLVVRVRATFFPRINLDVTIRFHDRFNPKSLLRLVNAPHCVSMIGVDLLHISCLPFITCLRCSDVSSLAPVNFKSLRITTGGSLEGIFGINPKVIHCPLMGHIGLLSWCWVQSLQRLVGGNRFTPLGQFNWPLFCLHLNFVQGLAFSREAQSRNDSLLNRLELQSWYVLILLSPLASFGSGSKQKIVKMVIDISSSPIRSIGILIGAPYSSLPFSNGWSLDRDLFRGVLESHASGRLNCIRVLVVMMGSLIRSIGILIGIHNDSSPLFGCWDLWKVMKLGGIEPESEILSCVHQLVQRHSLSCIKLASFSDVTFPIRESTTYRGLVRRTHHPARQITARRLHPLLEEYQTALKRDLIGFSKAVLFRSTSEKCEKLCFMHLDPIEDNLGEYHRWTMSFGDLSFSISCTFVARLIFSAFMVWFEDAINMDVRIM